MKSLSVLLLMNISGLKLILFFWEKVVWEYWYLPRHAFILWLAIMAKLKTRDRLRIIPSDILCVFCMQEETRDNHLSFACLSLDLSMGENKDLAKNNKEYVHSEQCR